MRQGMEPQISYLGPEYRWKALGLAIVKQAVVD